MRGLLRCYGILACALVATPATAAEIFPGIVIQDVSVTNRYSYAFGSKVAPSTTGGEQDVIQASDQRPNPTSQLGVQYTGQATPDSFYFLHNDYCVGECQITSSTNIRFTVFVADQGTFEGLRFDSLITPGHLALVGLGSSEDTAASFAFTVSRTDFVRGQVPGTPTELYSANGYSDIFGLRVETSDQQSFNNVIQGDNGGAGQYYDWSATPLSVELGAIATGQTFYVDYTASYSVQSYNSCTDILNCNAAQVVFGDPRNIGGGTATLTDSVAFRLLASEPKIDGGVHAVITRDYDASIVPFAFVPSGFDRTIVTPGPIAPITYIANYIPNAFDTAPSVPEPSTWALMVIGFGAMAAALRRRASRHAATI